MPGTTGYVDEYRSAKAHRVAAERVVGIGLVGCGFMGRVHSHAWRQIPRFFDAVPAAGFRAVHSNRPEAARAFAERWGWESVSPSLRELLDRDDVDLIDVVTPNQAHADVVIAAAEAGKSVACEKPLAGSLHDARRMLEAVERAGVEHFVWFNYRAVPAVALARTMLGEGRLGRVYRVRASYLQDWLIDAPDASRWRTRADCGGGVTSDLVSHSVDLIRHLTGCEFVRVCAAKRALVGERIVADGEPADDTVMAVAELANGAQATLEASRIAVGHGNSNVVEINGERGAVRYDLSDFNALHFWDQQLPPRERGWRRIYATGPHVPYASRYWPVEHALGYAETFVNTAADLLESLSGRGAGAAPTFRDGVRCQEVLEALHLSATQSRWVSLAEIAVK